MSQQKSKSKPKKIFWKRYLSSKYVGFDLDHTISKYHKLKLSILSTKCYTKYLVNEKGYPEKVLKFAFDPKICVKGNLVDIEKGNLLKVDSEKKICKVLHGDKIFNESEIAKEYGENLILDGFEGFSNKKYLVIGTYFEIGAGYCFNRLVLMSEKGGLKPKKTNQEIYSDLIESLIYTYRVYEQGDFYPSVSQDLPGIFDDNTKDLKQLFRLLRKDNKKIFLLTNSIFGYVNLTLDYLLGSNWQEYFDLILMYAKKPVFFQSGSQTPFIDVKTQKECSLKIRYPLQNGNVKDLMKFLDLEQNNEIIYFGDHPIGDVREAKNHVNWTTVSVIEELDIYNNEQSDNYSESIEKRKQIWGDYLFCNKKPSYWGSILNQFSDYQTASLSHFLIDLQKFQKFGALDN
ncbi:5'-nucleotidase domain-containing protein [Anaeramoeba flamelloides]|uniref:5'-nucleotidase domain-containing protein n=1 Tax=Anaeramoeba flamelloides TaxID=1746091 RepID=A0ABQ8Z6T7_9EUKA|nr:5'-nucleotidase domain-containing protein [Anaeramoeba flamelloides]